MPDQEKIENDRALGLAASRKDDGKNQKPAKRAAAKKIEIVEAAIMLGVAALGDGLASLVFWAGSAMLFFLPGVGIVISGIIKLVTWGIILIWIELRGLKTPWGGLMKLTGGLDFVFEPLPTYIGMVLFVIIYNNSPKLQTAAGLAKIA